jgi:hypothetical protein
MKKIFTLLALTISFSMNAQMTITSGQNTGTFASNAGWDTTSSGTASTALGYGTSATTHAALSTGTFTTASNYSSVAMGENSIASGSRSFAAGQNTIASDFASFVIGQYNSSGSLSTSVDSFSTSAPAFVIGNGADSSNKSDAFKVMFNGDATVSNDLTVSGDVVVSSDARLKSNIVSLGSTLSRILLIDGKSYEMKGKQKIGVLAQEIKEVFPELVSEDENEMLAVNYQGLVPVLINALKEQDERMKEQQSEIETYRDEVSELKEIVQELASRY